jgi:hypothetical protein
MVLVAAATAAAAATQIIVVWVPASEGNMKIRDRVDRKRI